MSDSDKAWKVSVDPGGLEGDKMAALRGVITKMRKKGGA